MAQKSLKANAFLNTLKTVLTLFFPLITFPYSSRVLGPESIGKVNFAQSVVSYFAIIASLGISTYATREIAKVRDNKEQMNLVATEVFVINMIATFISYLLLAALLFFVRKFDDYRLLIIICSSLIIFTTVGMGWLYQAVEDYLYITVRSLAFQIISVILLFTLVKSKDDYLWYAAVNIISNVGANILNIIHARKFIKFNFKAKLEMRKHLKPIFVLFAVAITGSIFGSIDKTMLGFMSTDDQVGLYSAGVKLIRMIDGLFPALIAVIFPRISYYFSTGNKEKVKTLSEKTVNCLICFSLPVTIGLFLLMEPLILVFCGEKYLGSVLLARILCPYLIFTAMAHFMGGTFLIASGKERFHLYAMLASSLLDIVLNVFFIRSHGATGAAFATLISQIFLSLCDFIFLRDVMMKMKVKKSAFQFFIAALLMGVTVHFSMMLLDNFVMQILFSVVTGAVTYAFMLFILRNRFFLETSGEIVKKIKSVIEKRN
ncbi:MAG: flippase [Treponema sp.]|nr:flippase [Treponema sp.]